MLSDFGSSAGGSSASAAAAAALARRLGRGRLRPPARRPATSTAAGWLRPRAFRRRLALRSHRFTRRSVASARGWLRCAPARRGRLSASGFRRPRIGRSPPPAAAAGWPACAGGASLGRQLVGNRRRSRSHCSVGRSRLVTTLDDPQDVEERTAQNKSQRSQAQPPGRKSVNSTTIEARNNRPASARRPCSFPLPPRSGNRRSWAG